MVFVEILVFVGFCSLVFGIDVFMGFMLIGVDSFRFRGGIFEGFVFGNLIKFELVEFEGIC